MLPVSPLPQKKWGTACMFLQRGIRADLRPLARELLQDAREIRDKPLIPGSCAPKRRCGGMADATDSKSVVLRDVWVQLPPPAPYFIGEAPFRRLRKVIPRKKHFRSYPVVKVGRFGAGCRFITVDAYNNDKAINFYLKNSFNFLTSKDVKEDTRLMYFDLITFMRP